MDEPPARESETALQRPFRNREKTMTVTRNQDVFRETSQTRRTEVPVPREDVRFSPPLLMAPPRSNMNEIQHRLNLSLLNISTSLGLDPASVRYSVQLGVFLIKITCLVRPCFPYVASPAVGIPLLLVAVLDFGLPGSAGTSAARARRSVVSSGPGMSTLLLAAHISVLWLASSWGALCVPAPRDVWADW